MRDMSVITSLVDEGFTVLFWKDEQGNYRVDIADNKTDLGEHGGLDRYIGLAFNEAVARLGLHALRSRRSVMYTTDAEDE